MMLPIYVDGIPKGTLEACGRACVCVYVCVFVCVFVCVSAYVREKELIVYMC